MAQKKTYLYFYVSILRNKKYYVFVEVYIIAKNRQVELYSLVLGVVVNHEIAGDSEQIENMVNFYINL